jgi:LmbE family N-acetylglucosaminyl deacetylase
MRKALVIAPHPDDETLGAGGTIKRLSDTGWHVTVLTVAAHMPPLYTKDVHEGTVREARSAHKVLGVAESTFLDNPALSLSTMPLARLNHTIHDEIARLLPDALFIPFYDRHIDHRAIFDACMVAARPVGVGKHLRLVAAYETISETHWIAPGVEPQFAPTLFVDIGEQIDAKLDAMAKFESQVHPFPGPRSLEALRALATFRGSQSGHAYAEAFYVVRMNGELFL